MHHFLIFFSFLLGQQLSKRITLIQLRECLKKLTAPFFKKSRCIRSSELIDINTILASADQHHLRRFSEDELVQLMHFMDEGRGHLTFEDIVHAFSRLKLLETKENETSLAFDDDLEHLLVSRKKR